MHRPASSLVAGLLLAVVASSAWSLNLGRGNNTSTLGQPLSFSVPVNVDAEELLAPECVGAEVFAGDVRLQPQTVRVLLEAGVNPTQATIRVVTNSVIDEPVVTVSVGVGCPQRITRKFVLFVDPPLVAFGPFVGPSVAPLVASAVAPAGAAAVATRPADRPTASPSLPALSASPSRAAPDRKPRAGRAVPSSAGVALQERNSADAPARRANRTPVAGRTPTRAAPPSTTARLKLEPSTAVAAAAPVVAAAPAVVVAATTAATTAEATASAASASAVPVLSALAAAAAGEPASAPSAAELLANRRVAALEDSLATLRAEASATRGSIESLQSRLREADAARSANPLVWGLGLLAATLALAVAGLLWRQSRERHPPDWWENAAAQAAAEVAVPVARARTDTAETGPMRMSASAVDSDFLSSPFTQPMHDSFTVTPLPADDASGHPQVFAPAVAALSRELSVDELIDLEQQADFFIVLGQDEAAIDLLMSHVRSTGGVSPMPYIKLLEIYRRQGDFSAYERIRERFNRRFNADVPGSDADPGQGRSVEDYPEILSELIRVWAVPVQAVEQLGQWLARSGAGGPAFDLPAYAELLFLHALARDLAEHDTSKGSIDVLLPLASEHDQPSISTLSATMPFDAGASAGATSYELDLDLTMPVEGDSRPGQLASDFISLDDDIRYRS